MPFPHRSPALVRGLATACLALAVGAGTVFAGGGAEAKRYPEIFRSQEKRSTNLTPFPKWRGTVKRYFDESKVAEDCKPGSRLNVCHLDRWDRFLAGLKGRDVMSQLRAVNSEMNRRRYVLDPINWGVKDYWASPLQFFRRQGDCEDYAITKYMSLRALGVPPEDMRIVVVMDNNLRLAHAILVVYVEGRAYVLDNQISRVVRAETIRHYQPIYSLNETAWYLHKQRA